MGADWQTLAAFAVVGVAAVYLLFQLWSTFSNRSKTGCGSSCSGCETKSATDAAIPTKPFVSIESLTTNTKQ